MDTIATDLSRRCSRGGDSGYSSPTNFTNVNVANNNITHSTFNIIGRSESQTSLNALQLDAICAGGCMYICMHGKVEQGNSGHSSALTTSFEERK